MRLRRAETVEESSRAFVARHFGSEGAAWVAGMPAVLEQLTAAWKLSLGPPLHGGLMSAVHLVTRADGSSAVLKVAGPWAPTRDEETALRVWAGGRAPQLLAADVEHGALLLELVAPGIRAVDAAAVEVADVLAALHAPAVDGLPSLAGLVRERLERARSSGAPGHKLDWALAKLEELEETPARAVLLHGDFDDRNLLVCAQRGLCAIDPWPCAGDPSYDAAYWVHANRRPGRRARLDGIVAATGLPRDRVRDWAAIIAVHG